MTFAWPWAVLVLPLPWLLHRLSPADAGAVALRVPHLPDTIEGAGTPRPALALWLAALAWVLLVGAAMRPQISAGVRLQSVSGRDLMLAFDVSASMATSDLRLGGKAANRLHVARTFAEEFLKRRQGDRVGLIVFGSQAYLHTPLTFDLDAVRVALAAMEAGFAGRETALGDAIGLATKHLTPLANHTRELILLTDGANNAGTLAPARAAWLAQRNGVRIHAIGIGAAPKPGNADNLDEATLKQIATQSGGSYQRATDSAAIEHFFERIEQITPGVQTAVPLRPRRELYPWPLGLALGLAAWLALRRVWEVAP